MAATTATALKQLVEGGGLGLSGYRDAAPSDATAPFVVITEGISVVPDRTGGDGLKDDTATENVQMDLYETYVNDSNPAAPVLAESYTLAAGLRRLIHGASLPAAPFHVYAVRVELSSRTRDVELNLVRTRYSVNIYRSL